MGQIALFPVAPAARLFEIGGDVMEPRLRARDFLIVSPCRAYQYEALYLLDFGHGEEVHLAQRLIGGGVLLRRPNPLYGEHRVSAAEFSAAVTAMCVAEVRVTDVGYMRRAA